MSYTPDTQAYCTKQITDICAALSAVNDAVLHGHGGEELITNALRVASYYLGDVSKVLGVESETASEREKRFADLRAANFKIRDLQNQLGLETNAIHVQSALKRYDKAVRGWWGMDGFGHISKFHFHANGGAEFELSCYLHNSTIRTHSRTPVTDKQTHKEWLAELPSRGFVMTEEDRDYALLDCDDNRDLLREVIQTSIPCARIFSYKNHSNSQDVMVLDHVEVYVPVLSELEMLDRNMSAFVIPTV